MEYIQAPRKNLLSFSTLQSFYATEFMVGTMTLSCKTYHILEEEKIKSVLSVNSSLGDSLWIYTLDFSML